MGTGHWQAGRYDNPMPYLILSPSHGSKNSAKVLPCTLHSTHRQKAEEWVGKSCLWSESAPDWCLSPRSWNLQTSWNNALLSVMFIKRPFSYWDPQKKEIWIHSIWNRWKKRQEHFTLAEPIHQCTHYPPWFFVLFVIVLKFWFHPRSFFYTFFLLQHRNICEVAMKHALLKYIKL